jgi:23S rRNA pseudouridine1911/1915/1917 synthase
MKKPARENASAEPTPRTEQGRRGRKRPRRIARTPPDKLIVPQEAEFFRVHPDQAGMRLDQFLKMRLHWRSRTKVQELIAEREVTARTPGGSPVGLRLDCSYRVKLGEEIRLPLPPPPEAAYRIAEIPVEILYEDDLLIVLNKPPDLVVHPAGRHRYDTLINALHLRYRNLHDPKQDIIPRLAHRIDRETSGALIAYKMRRHERASPMVFERTHVAKEYLAIAEGVLEQDSGVIDLPIARQPDIPRDQAQVIVHPRGQASRTGYQVLERFRGFTFLQCRLFTGRMHQIRVHLQAIGHPVLCDKRYGLRAELLRSDLGPLSPGEEDRVLLSRQALHAWRIRFNHPVGGSPVAVEAPLPPDMRTVLDALRGGRAAR